MHFHDLRRMAETLMHDAGGSAKSGSIIKGDSDVCSREALHGLPRALPPEPTGREPLFEPGCVSAARSVF
jgi:hypothetical protein